MCCQSASDFDRGCRHAVQPWGANVSRASAKSDNEWQTLIRLVTYAPVRGLSKTYFSLHFFLDKIFLCFSCFISYLFICVVVNCAHYVDASISLSLKHEEWVTLGLVIQGRYWRCCSGRLGLESRTPASRFSIARREDRLGLQDASSTALAVR